MDSLTQIQTIQLSLPQNPIFVVGSPRSGTTLLQALLYTQPDIVSFPETHMLDFFLPRLRMSESNLVNIHILQNTLWGEFQQRTQLDFSPEIWAYLQAIFDKNELTDKFLYEFIVSTYLLQKTGELQGSYRWLEKTPSNVFHIGTLLDWYPQAKVIHIIRNPYATVASQYTKFIDYQRKHNYPVPRLDMLAKEWKRTVEHYQEYQAKYPQQVFGTHYEELTNNTMQTIESICAFLGIEFDNTNLSNYTQKATQVSHDWETWKQQVSENVIENTNEKTISLLTLRQKLYIQGIFIHVMIEHGYLPLYPVWIQKAHSLFNRLTGLHPQTTPTNS